jgi:uncharacterized membrane protein YbhN (UPF0104 family)
MLARVRRECPARPRKPLDREMISGSREGASILRRGGAGTAAIGMRWPMLYKIPCFVETSEPPRAVESRDRALDQGHVGKDAEPEPNAPGWTRGFPRRHIIRLVRAVGIDRKTFRREFERVAHRHSLGRWVAAGFSLAIAALSIAILAHTISGVSWSALGRAITATSGSQIVAAMALTAISFLALTGYDGLALRQLQLRVPYRTTALASFTSYAISFTLGFPLITAATVRLWIYSRLGLTAAKVASLTIIAGVSFWFGLMFVIGAGLLFRGEAISAVNHLAPILNRLIGLVVLGGIVAYLGWVTIRRRRVRLHGFQLELPGLGVTLGQIALGIIDQCAAAGTLYMLLPHRADIDYFAFAATYAFACILGVASNAPGGIGVFEAAMLKAVPIGSQESLLAALVLFRVIYYLIPFGLALALLGGPEALRRWRSLRREMRRNDEAA